MNLANLIPGISLSLLALAEVGLFVYFLRYEKTITIKAYLTFIAAVIVWVVSNTIPFFQGNGDVSYVAKFSYISGTLMGSSFLLFVYSFPHPRSKNINWIKFLPLLSTIIFAIAYLSTDNIQVILHDGISDSEFFGPLNTIWTTFFLTIWTIAVVELFRQYIQSRGDNRKRFELLIIGVIISSFVGILTDVIFPITKTTHFAWIGPSASIVWLWCSVLAVKVR